MIRRLYRLIALAMPACFYLAGFFSKKMRQGWLLRQGSPWLRGARASRPVWIHCASGEFEYAKPVIRKLKHDDPAIKIMVTYFSPSVRQSVEAHADVDFATPSPWENPSLLREFIAYHQPRALLIARTDAWPEMVHQARKAAVPSLLFSATLVRSSQRLKWPAKTLTTLSLRDLSQIFCVSEQDAEIFSELGFAAKTQVAGDTRFDQVLARLQTPKPLNPHAFGGARIKIVCGSTWPEDERELLRAMTAFSETAVRPQWVLVPHEPTPDHLEPLTVQIRSLGLTVSLYSEAIDASADVVIVDRIGILAELYALADLAFVGGSYRKTVHSVMEPLAAGCLTFVGPFYQNNREAIQFHLLNFVQVERDGVAMGRDMLAALTLSESDRADRRRAILDEILRRSGRSARVAAWVYQGKRIDGGTT